MRWALTLTAAVALAQLPDAKYARPAPEQPLPFSHKTHVSQGLKCAQCHPNPEPGDFMTLPKTSVCMTCHASVKKDSPHIQQLAALAAEGKRVAWAPVYRVPDWVSFNHKKHIGVEGVTCETCHGKVAQQEILRREKDLSMAGCLECHRAKAASIDCLLCHDQR
jgi:hypothetical protein